MVRSFKFLLAHFRVWKRVMTSKESLDCTDIEEIMYEEEAKLGLTFYE